MFGLVTSCLAASVELLQVVRGHVRGACEPNEIGMIIIRNARLNTPGEECVNLMALLNSMW